MSNYFPVGKIGASTTYADKALCELVEGQECFDVSLVPSDIAKVIEVQEPVMIEVIKERPLLDELGQPVLDEQGQPIIEQYGDIEQAKDAEGNLIFETVKKVVADEIKVSAKDAEKQAKQEQALSIAEKLANLKVNGSKDIKDLIEILGL